MTSNLNGSRVSVHKRLHTLRSVATDIVRNLDFDATLLSISNAAVDVLAADVVGIMIAEGDQLKMRSCAGHRNIAAARFEVRAGEGVAGRVLAGGVTVRLDDFQATIEISEEIKEIAEAEGIRAALGAPLLADGQVIGAIMAWSCRPAAFTEQDETEAEGLAALASIAVQNARLYQRAQDAVHDLEQANSRLREQYDLLRGASSVQRELTELVLDGRGLGGLVEMVARYTAGDVAVLSPELEPFAATPDAGGLVERAADYLRRRQSMVPPGEPAPTGLLVREVTSGGERMAYLCVAVPVQPGELSPLIAEQASVVCALELTKARAVLDARTWLRSDFLWDLLEGKVPDDAAANVRARYLGHTLPRRLRVVLVDVEGLQEWAKQADVGPDAVDRRRSTLLSTVERAAAAAGKARVLSGRRVSTMALIVPWLDEPGDARELVRNIVRELTGIAPDLKFRVGVSAGHALAADLSPALTEARTALASTGTTQSAALFDELGVLRFLLAPGERGDLAEFVRRVLGPLQDYDHDHNTDILDTLATYLAEDGNIGRAAGRLFVHPKTVRYRLKRVRDLIGRDLASPTDAFDIQLALNIKRALDADHLR